MGKKKHKRKAGTKQIADSIELSSKQIKNSNGFLICNDAVIAREGIQQYAPWELPESIASQFEGARVVNVYRSLDTLQEHMPDYNGLPVTDGHLWEPISVKNKEHIGGVAADIKSTATALKGRLTVFDSNMIFDIEQKEKIQLSLGYLAEFEIQAGTHDGQPYDVVQTTIKPNHIALTRNGRCGPECHIADSKQINDCNCHNCMANSSTHKTPTKGNTSMADKAQDTIRMSVRDAVVNVTDESVPVINALLKEIKDSAEQIELQQTEVDALKKQIADAAVENSPEKMQKQIADAAAIRATLVTKAQRHIDDDLSAMSNRDVMLAVLKKNKLLTDDSAATVDDNYIGGAFAALTANDTARKENNSSNNGVLFAGDSGVIKNGMVTDDGMHVMVNGKPMCIIEAARKGLTGKPDESKSH